MPYYKSIWSATWVFNHEPVTNYLSYAYSALGEKDTISETQFRQKYGAGNYRNVRVDVKKVGNRWEVKFIRLSLIESTSLAQAKQDMTVQWQIECAGNFESRISPEDALARVIDGLGISDRYWPPWAIYQLDYDDVEVDWIGHEIIEVTEERHPTEEQLSRLMYNIYPSGGEKHSRMWPQKGMLDAEISGKKWKPNQT